VVEELGQIFKSSGIVVVSRYKGLTVAEMTAYRNALREVGGSVRVAKNQLAKIALKNHPTTSLGDILTGMTVLSYGEDPVATAKAVEDFVKANPKLEIIGGALGQHMLDREGIAAVSKMPSREDVIGTIVSILGAPASGLVGAIRAPASSIVEAIGTPASSIAGILATVEGQKAA